MERRALLAVVISLTILILYQEVVLRYLYHPVAAPEPEATASSAPAPASRAEPEPLPEAALPAPQPAAPARRVRIQTDLYEAEFTSAGARLASFRLKRYRTTVDPGSPPQEMVVPGAEGELPFGVELRGAHAISDAGAPYTCTGSDIALQPGETGALEFVWPSPDGTIRKRFEFSGGRYAFDAAVRAANVSAPYNELALAWVKAAEASPTSGPEIVFDQTAYLFGKKLIEDHFDKLSDGKIVPSDITGPAEVAWAGFVGRHFIAALMPIGAPNTRLWLKLRNRTVEEKLLFPISGGAIEQQVEVYLGPKDIDTLETVGHGLGRAVNFGWFEIIAVPLLHAIDFSHRVTHNYGIDIILLTVVIKLLFLPLTQRSFQSMRAMQKLQPQMTKIREKYKDDSEQMNKEIMELYRRHKVNPLGGCLPMVLQIPVFIGLYQALLHAVELRHAPFMLWINDLSAPDRLGTIQLPFVQHPGIPVLTLFMGASMFAQQWMSPTAGDPAQQRVMMIMPLMFTFMFVNFPAGLSLYWLVNNVLTIAQQYYINRTTT